MAVIAHGRDIATGVRGVTAVQDSTDSTTSTDSRARAPGTAGAATTRTDSRARAPGTVGGAATTGAVGRVGVKHCRRHELGHKLVDARADGMSARPSAYDNADACGNPPRAVAPESFRHLLALLKSTGGGGTRFAQGERMIQNSGSAVRNLDRRR